MKSYSSSQKSSKNWIWHHSWWGISSVYYHSATWCCKAALPAASFLSPSKPNLLVILSLLSSLNGCPFFCFYLEKEIYLVRK
jgi:hypothetical protein